MNKLALALAIAASAAATAHAADVIYAPSADTTAYTVVSVDPRRLKSTLQNALAQWPGEECYAFADTNAQLNCPGLISDVNTYNLAEGFTAPSTTTTDSKGRVTVKALRVDGLKWQQFSNFLVPGQCVITSTGTVCPTTPPARAVHFTATKPMTEFGFEYRPDQPQLSQPFIAGWNITVNGVDMGYFPTWSLTGVQFIGVHDSAGIQSVTMRPVEYASAVYSGSYEVTGPFLGNRLFYK